jgi:FKBP-type peptidyl-prolyl cis-trans isomerase FklB
MKLRWIAVFLGVVFLAGQLRAEQILTLKNQKERMSYLMGMEIGRNLKTQSVEIDPDILARGIRDALSGDKSLLTGQEIHDTVALLQEEVRAKQQALAEKNKKEGEAFLAKDKKKEGIVALPSGLEYKVIKAGIGRKPKSTDSVTVHYRATLMDGTEFSSSYRRGQPQTLSVNEVIPGLAEALPLMQEGSTWELFIPPNLAYGERGQGNAAGPNGALIFEIELISVQERN